MIILWEKFILKVMLYRTNERHCFLNLPGSWHPSQFRCITQNPEGVLMWNLSYNSVTTIHFWVQWPEASLQIVVRGSRWTRESSQENSSAARYAKPSTSGYRLMSLPEREASCDILYHRMWLYHRIYCITNLQYIVDRLLNFYINASNSLDAVISLLSTILPQEHS